MEKIIIKPTVKEIVLRGKPEDGHVDVFSYNYKDDSANGLGGLFIVGHVQPATEDTSYMVNLVASLAKREYYAQPNVAPKEAFSRTLKKINEALQDFFRNKDLKINIGVFAISGENIFISRLGKFKILLARDNQNIDILNNINLFNKEHIQDKEFSNIISGKVAPQDKIFAFYPARYVTARERYIKSYLLKLDADEFSEKLDEIKKKNENFLCASVHISIDKHKELAVINTPQPHELQKPEELSIKEPSAKLQPILTQSSKTKADATPMNEAAPNVRPPKKQPEKNDQIENSNVSYQTGGDSAGNKLPQNSPEQKSEESQQFIIPSEFSSAKKGNFIDVMLKKFKPSGVYVIGASQGISKKQKIITGSVIAVVAFLIVAKFTMLPSLPIPGIPNENNKAVSLLVDQMSDKLNSAKDYRDQSNLFEARRTLIESLSILASSTVSDTGKTDDLKTEILTLLDQIDNAIESSPNLLYQISDEVGKSSLITTAEDKLLVYASGPTAESGVIMRTTEAGIESTSPVNDFDPSYLIGTDGIAILISKLNDRIGSLTLEKGDLKTAALSLAGSAQSYYPYQDNLYVLTSDSIYKITDALKGKNSAVSWLTEGTKLPANPLLLAIDGDVFVLTKDGILSTYYKGKKKSEVNTSIPVSSASLLLTTDDSDFLYLVDKTLGRIYMLTKKTGSLVKTLKVGNHSIMSASISKNEILYILTQDNKVWKVVP